MVIEEAKATIQELNQEFDSHEFIKNYLRLFPASYGRLLEKYDNLILANSEVSRFLSANADELKIQRVGNNMSLNILDNNSDNALWRKIS